MAALWAITSFFNPQGYRRKLHNYHTFRHRLEVPLLTVELSYGPHFALASDDADSLVQVSGRDVMWQKKRLLNLALAALPDACHAVAWLDCDIVFARRDWAQKALERLERFSLVQLFAQAHHLSRESETSEINLVKTTAGECSFASFFMQNQGVPEVFRAQAGGRCGSVAPGIAWAARRSLLERHGFYDACILGGGDTAFAHAACGSWEGPIRAWPMNEKQAEHYRNWAEPFYADVRGDIAHLDGDLFHLWHGDLRQRRYRERHRKLLSFAYDPKTDLALDESGCWRWNSAKPELHRYVEQYFALRNEDGESLKVPAASMHGEAN